MLCLFNSVAMSLLNRCKLVCLAALVCMPLFFGSALAGPIAKPSDVLKPKPTWTNEYDGYFRRYSKRYFGPFFDWKWFKAQAIAESSLKPNARSWVGAVGLMQIMPATYGDILKMNPHFKDIHSERWNIAAGIYYDRYLYREWAGLPSGERLKFAFASYNAGLGNILKARRRSGGEEAQQWADIAGKAPKETQGYVKRILEIYPDL